MPMPKEHNQQPAKEPLARLLHDLDVIGRMEGNARAPGRERLAAVLGDDLLAAITLSLLTREETAAQRKAPGQAA